MVVPLFIYFIMQNYMYYQLKSLLTNLVGLLLFVSINTGVYACDQQTNASSTMHLTGNNLELLGEGIRQELLVNVYHLALYSEADNTNALLKSVTSYPVAIRIEVLTDILPDIPPDHWLKLFSETMTPDHFNLLVENYKKLADGDVLLLSYLPGEGTSVFMRDKLLFKTPESRIIEAVINGIIGPEPFSTELKQSILES